MNYNQFQNIPEKYPEKGKIGDMFLTGSLIEQKHQKKKGDYICYYKILSINEKGNIEYSIAYDVLDNGDDNE